MKRSTAKFSSGDSLSNAAGPPIELTASTKEYLRRTLVTSLSIPPPLPFPSAVVKSLSVIIAKIGRYDASTEFAALLPTLLQSFATSTFSMRCLSKLLKELSTQRILLHKKNFASISTTSFPSVADFFAAQSNKLHELLSSGDASNAALGPELYRFKVVCKILCRLVVNTLPSLLENFGTAGAVARSLEMSLNVVSFLAERFYSLPPGSDVAVALSKIIDVLSRMSVDAQVNHSLQVINIYAVPTSAMPCCASHTLNAPHSRLLTRYLSAVLEVSSPPPCLLSQNTDRIGCQEAAPRTTLPSQRAGHQ